jgi:acyl carrier protein
MDTEKANPTREKIIEQVHILVEPWLNDADESAPLSEQTNMLTELGLDSVAILQLVLGIEKKFDVTINNDELDSEVFSKMANLIDLIEDKLNEID